MMGLLVLLKDHAGTEDLARLADDLDLEIDEILPSVEFAEALGFVTVTDGKGTLTDAGRKLLSGTIRMRKAVLRDALKSVPPFSDIIRAMEKSLTKRLRGNELAAMLSPMTVPSDVTFENFITWGRFTELFRYDAEDNVLKLARRKSSDKTTGSPTGV